MTARSLMAITSMEPSLDLTLQIILTVTAGLEAQVLAEFLKPHD